MLTPDQEDMLAELLNIAFARAASPLATLMGRFVELTAPDVSTISRAQALDWLKTRFGHDSHVHVVQQSFHPTLAGEAILVMRADERAHAWGLFADPDEEPEEGEEQDAALEVANLLVGACIGRLAGLLRTSVRYTPPRLALFDRPLTELDIAQVPDITLVVVHTRFTVEGTRFESCLFLVLAPEVVDWLRETLDDLIETYLLEPTAQDVAPRVEIAL